MELRLVLKGASSEEIRRGEEAAHRHSRQWLWVDPETGVVIARTASRADPSDDAATARDIAVLGQIVRRL